MRRPLATTGAACLSGADAAACLLATGIAEGDTLAALVDIGTNTEAFIGNRQRLLAASCPAGPAFEGGGVRFGGTGSALMTPTVEKLTLDDRISLAADAASLKP